MDNLTYIIEHAKELKQNYTIRNNRFDTYEAMYLMRDPEIEQFDREHKQEGLRLTVSPDPRNKLDGAKRLLSANGVVFSVPRDRNNDEAEKQSSKLEKAADIIWRAASRVWGAPLEHDIIHSALLFSEMQVMVSLTRDILERVRKAKNKVMIARWEAIAEQTPVIFEVLDPRTGYPEIGTGGLTAFYREVVMQSGELLDTFPDAVKYFPDRNRYQDVTVCHWWDTEQWVVYLDSNRVLYEQELASPDIPIVVELSEGSRLFEKEEDKRQPFFYTLKESRLWQSHNRALTMLFSSFFQLANPSYVHTYAGSDPAPLHVDTSIPGGVIDVPAGDNLQPLQKNIVDPALRDVLEVIERKGEESTIFAQALGQPLSGNAPYSMVALLHQAGRLPLAVPALKVGWACASAMKLALRWIKDGNHKAKLSAGGDVIDLPPAEIPKAFEIEATLDPSLSMEVLQNANIAGLLKDFVSDEWILENVLKIGQPEAEIKRKWTAGMREMLVQKYVQERMAPPPPPAPVPMNGGGLPEGGGQPVAANGVGIPNQMMMGGMQGPEPAGMGGMAPEEGMM
jgi:hypothetical protein